MINMQDSLVKGYFGDLRKLLREIAASVYELPNVGNQTRLRERMRLDANAAIAIIDVLTDNMLRCEALRGPESHQPTCCLERGHEGNHAWWRQR